MTQNLAIGCVTIVVCMIIQCIFVGALFATLVSLEKRRFIKRTFVGLSALLLFIMLTMLAGNFLQMALWAALFVACGEFQTFDAAFYHSVVNFTSLGYGDVVMSEDPDAATAVRTVYGMRLEFLRRIFSDLGFRGQQLEMRTRLFVCCHSWEQVMFEDLSKDECRKLLRLRHKMLVTK